MKNIKIEVGDLVQLNKTWKQKIGIVRGTDKDWWCIKNHFDVEGCIAHKTTIKIIKKGVVPKKLRRYLNK